MLFASMEKSMVIPCVFAHFMTSRNLCNSNYTNLIPRHSFIMPIVIVFSLSEQAQLWSKKLCVCWWTKFSWMSEQTYVCYFYKHSPICLLLMICLPSVIQRSQLFSARFCYDFNKSLSKSHAALIRNSDDLITLKWLPCLGIKERFDHRWYSSRLNVTKLGKVLRLKPIDLQHSKSIESKMRVSE